MKRIALIAMIAGAALLALPLGGMAADPVKIGMVFPVTGRVAYDGQAVVSGVKAAIAYVNGKGGILGGRKVELEFIDSGCKPADAVSGAKKLISQYGLKAIIGDFCSNATLAVQQVTEEEGVVLITPVSVSPKLTETGAKLFFRNNSTSKMHAKTFSGFVHNQLKPGTVAMLAKNDEYGKRDTAAYKALYKKLGGPKVVYVGFFGSNDEDYSPQLTKIKSLKPGAVYVVAQTEQGSNILKQMRDLGLNVKKLGAGALFNPKVVELAGKAAEGMYVYTGYDPSADNPGMKVFQEQMKKSTGKPGGLYEAMGFDTTIILLAAIDKAGTDKDAVKIAKALRATDYTGPRGRITFDQKGQALIKTKIVQVQDGKFKRVH